MDTERPGSTPGLSSATSLLCAGCVDSFLVLAFVIKARIGRESSFLTLYIQLCDSESGKGDADIESTALGLLYPGMKRSQMPAFTVP